MTGGFSYRIEYIPGIAIPLLDEILLSLELPRPKASARFSGWRSRRFWKGVLRPGLLCREASHARRVRSTARCSTTIPRWQSDVTFGEDRRSTRKNSSPSKLAIVRRDWQAGTAAI